MQQISPRWMRAGCLGLLALAGWGCRQSNEYVPPPPPEVKVARPLVRDVQEYLTATGTTEAYETVEIRARVKGFLKEVNFEPGAEVSPPDPEQLEDPATPPTPLYLIEPDEYQAKRQQAEAELEAARARRTETDAKLKRQQKLFAQGATAEEDLEAAKADFESAEAAIKLAQANLRVAELDLQYTRIYAPIEGRIGKTLVDAGNLVGNNETTLLTTIVRYDPIFASFTIPEPDLLRILAESPAAREESGTPDPDRPSGPRRPDVPIELGLAIDEGYPHVGKFNYADLAVDAATGTYLVRAEFPNPDRTIPPGAFVRVRIPLERLQRENAILVPDSSLGADQQGRFLLVVDSDDTVEKRTVVVGSLTDDGLRVIQKGLQPDERFVTRDLLRARPGAKILPQLEELGGDTLEPSSEANGAPSESGAP